MICNGTVQVQERYGMREMDHLLNGRPSAGGIAEQTKQTYCDRIDERGSLRIVPSTSGHGTRTCELTAENINKDNYAKGCD